MSQKFTNDFIDYLQKMKNDRGKMATLRKGLTENQADATWPLLRRFINFDNPYQIKALQTVAGLFAYHPENCDAGNFGSLCRNLLDSDEKEKIEKGESGPIAKHFGYALAANGFEIFPRVRRLIMRAKKDEVPVNYLQLTDDMLGWQSPYRKERIKLDWAKAFWQMTLDTEADTTDSEDEGEDND